MIAFDLANEVRDRIASDIQVDAVASDQLVVYMPLLYDDGDQCSIYVTKTEGGQWVLSDEGDSHKRALDLGLNLTGDVNASRLKRLLDFYGVRDNKGALDISANEDSLVDSLFTLTQVCLETTWLAKARKPRGESRRLGFSQKFAKLVSKCLPNGGGEMNWHDPVHDPDRNYLVDWRAKGIDRQLFLFGIHSKLTCMNATITCQHYRMGGVDFEAVAIYDHEEELPKRYANQLNEVVDKRFPRIQEKKSIRNYLNSRVVK